MELSQLQYFQAVANYQTVTRAAQMLSITQSAVSKAIVALEAELGAPLFFRSNRRMTLTQDGAAFLAHVQDALSELERGKKEIMERTQTRKREIRLQIQTPEFLLGILETYMQDHPDVSLTQKYTSPDLESALLSGEITFCISSEPFSHGAITWKPLLTDQLYLMVSKDHPLAEKKEVSLSLFAGENFIVSNSNPDLIRATESFCKLAGFAPNIAYETGETPDMMKLVEMGLGAAFCSSCTRLRRFQDDHDYQEFDIAYRHLKLIHPQCSRTIGISFVRDRYLSPENQEFMDFVVEYFGALEAQIRRYGF